MHTSIHTVTVYTCIVLYLFKGELEEALNEWRNKEDQAKKAMMDAARLADELKQEQEHGQHLDRARKGLEHQLKVHCTVILLLNI